MWLVEKSKDDFVSHDRITFTSQCHITKMILNSNLLPCSWVKMLVDEDVVCGRKVQNESGG